VFGTNVWNKCSEQMFGTNVWNKCSEQMFGTNVWNKCSEQMFGTDVWLKCSEQMFGTDVWNKSSEQMFGTNVLPNRCSIAKNSEKIASPLLPYFLTKLSFGNSYTWKFPLPWQPVPSRQSV